MFSVKVSVRTVVIFGLCVGIGLGLGLGLV